MFFEVTILSRCVYVVVREQFDSVFGKLTKGMMTPRSQRDKKKDEKPPAPSKSGHGLIKTKTPKPRASRIYARAT
jgi:hypothetical protein